MKAKKFLKIAKHLCTEENCESDRCPFRDKKQGCLMLGSDNIPEYWHIKKILKRVKKARKRLC